MKKMEEILKGFKERYQSMAFFYPLFQLNNKEKYKDLDLTSLGLSTMLFILEKMLMNEEAATHKSVGKYIGELLLEKKKKKITEAEEEEISNFLLNLLMGEGRPFKYEFFDYEKGEKDYITFKLVTYDKNEYSIKRIKDKEEILKLTPEAIEMLFKTKEMFNELQISITQLYLRQQIEKRVFDGAVRISKELIQNVQAEIAKMESLENEIRRDAIKATDQKKMEEQLERIHYQLENQKKTFEELSGLIKETINEYYENELTEKEKIAVDNVLQVEKNLIEAAEEHNVLFAKKQSVQKLIRDSLENIILKGFSSKINFSKEILPALTNRLFSMESLISIVRPVTNVKEFNMMHPTQLFAEQKVKKEKEENIEVVTEITQEIKEAALEEELKVENKKKNIRMFMLEEMFNMLLESTSISLEELFNQMKDKDEELYQEAISEEYLYQFLIHLHQENSFKVEKINKNRQMYLEGYNRDMAELVDQNNDYAEIGKILLIPIADQVIKNGQYKIQNIQFIGGM